MTKARDLANASTALSAVDATELGYVDGVTSAIQTQLDAKIAKTLTSTTGDIIYASGANTPARLGIGSTGNVLTVASGIPSWAAPVGGGKILQVVSATSSSETDNVSQGTYADSGLTATITPSSSSSRILAIFSTLTAKNGVSASAGVDIQILRGATNIGYTSSVNYTGTAIYNITQFMTALVDSPATTSATTYKLVFKLSAGAGGNQISRVQANGSLGSVVLMEIGA